MPTVSRIFVKVSFFWLVCALSVGLGMTFGGPAMLAVLLPTHLHLFVVGWVTHMIFGVALWLFPKYTKEKPRGSDALSWACLATLNLGLVLRALAEPAPIYWPSFPWQPALVFSAILQWLAGLAFVINVWPRVKGTR